MLQKFNILIDLNLAYAFDRRAFEGIAATANERANVRLTRRMNETSWSDTLQSRPIDGVIVPRLDLPEREQLVRSGVPFVCLADLFADGKPVEADNQYVLAMDERAIGTMAAQHFLEAGFVNFAVFARPNVRDYFNNRIGSFSDEVRAAGFSCVVGPPEPAAWAALPQHEADDENGWEADSDAWLQSLPKPIAVFSPNDNYAQIAVNSARSAGLRVPDDVAVIGVDDDDIYCMTTSPQLSSVITPGRRVGQEALGVLLDAIAGKTGVPRRVLVPPGGIVIRGSTSDFALQDEDVIAAVRYIRDNVARHITVKQVAEHALLSRRTLERRFQVTLSHTIQDEIRRAKINRAKHLLIDTDLSFTQVAVLSGLVQQSQLNRNIRQATGMTPKQFRDAARQFRRT